MTQSVISHRIVVLEQAQASPKFTLVRGDTLDLSALTKAMSGTEFVFHLAANADVRFGTEHPRKDFNTRSSRRPRRRFAG